MTGLETLSFTEHDGPVTHVAFSSDARWPGKTVIHVRDCGLALGRLSR